MEHRDISSLPGTTGALLSRPHIRWLIAVLVVAFVVRLVWMVAVQPDPRDGRFDDSVWYYHAGLHLAAGDGYVVPGDAFCRFGDGIGCDETPPTANWAPGYPLALAGLAQLPGDNVAAARAFNLIASVALVAGVYYLGARIWSRRAGLIATGAMALFPSSVFFSTLVMTEVFYTTLAVGLLCLTLAWTLRKDVALWRFAAIGVATALLAMVRPEGAMLALVIVAAWLAYHRSLRRVAVYAGLLVLGMAVVYTPWTVRNAVQLDAFVVATTGTGPVLIQAHHPDADGEPDIFLVVEYAAQFHHLPRPEREVRVNSEGTRDAMDYAVRHIPREMQLMWLRLAAFFHGDAVIGWVNHPDGDGELLFSQSWADRWNALADVYYYIVAAAMVFGAPFWLRRAGARHALVIGPLVLYAGMWALFFVGEPRYHFPLLPVFALLAGAGLAAALDRVAPEAPTSS